MIFTIIIFLGRVPPDIDNLAFQPESSQIAIVPTFGEVMLFFIAVIISGSVSPVLDEAMKKSEMPP